MHCKKQDEVPWVLHTYAQSVICMLVFSPVSRPLHTHSMFLLCQLLGEDGTDHRAEWQRHQSAVHKLQQSVNMYMVWSFHCDTYIHTYVRTYVHTVWQYEHLRMYVHIAVESWVPSGLVNESGSFGAHYNSVQPFLIVFHIRMYVVLYSLSLSPVITCYHTDTYTVWASA